jgi:fumarate reductase flavoprotein subunit
MESRVMKEDKMLKADIVVIGAGGAGLPAAVAAAENGVKNIIVLEKQNAPGGNALFAHGMLAAESALQKRLGVDTTRDKVFQKYMDYSHWKLNPRLIRATVDKSADNINWLEQKGVKFTRLIPLVVNPSLITYHSTEGPEKAGAQVTRALVNICKERGIRILLRTSAEKITVDKKGKVTGVEALSQGKKLVISTKCVIITTGGLAGNEKMIRQYDPDYREDQVFLLGMRHQGDGILMATRLGAATEGLVTYEREGPEFPWSKTIVVAARQAATIWVNSQGSRFADENYPTVTEAGNTIYRQPGRIMYSIFDEAIKESIINGERSPWEQMALLGKPLKGNIDKDLQVQSRHGRVKVSEDLGAIARWIGVPSKTLQQTVNEYNDFCDHGHDDHFVKDRRYLKPLRKPPYYAVRCGVGLLATHGGIKINHLMEVLDQQDKPIQGLYAAGIETGGHESDTYNMFLSGHSYGFTVGSGRIAGEEAAKYIKSRY